MQNAPAAKFDRITIVRLQSAAAATIVFGILCLVLPLYAGFAATYILAASFVVGGALHVLGGWRATGWLGKGGMFLVGGGMVLAGGVMLLSPLFGLALVTVIAIASILLVGILKSLWGITQTGIEGRSMLVASGALSVTIAILLYTQLPFSATWVVGVLFGVNLIGEGIGLLLFLAKQQPAPGQIG